MAVKSEKSKIGLYIGSFLFLFIFNICIGLVVAYLVYGQNQECIKMRLKRSVVEPEDMKECEHHSAVVNKAYSVFESFTLTEIMELREYFSRNRLGVSSWTNYRTNYTLGISLWPLDKQEVDQYYTERKHNENVKPPDRYALVKFMRGALSAPDVMEYKIGPVGGTLSHKELLKPGQVPLNGRTNYYIEFDIQVNRLLSNDELMPLINLTKESFDGAIFPNDLAIRRIDPPGLETPKRSRRYTFNFHVPDTVRGFDLVPAPLYFTYNSTGLETDQWYTHSYYYLNQGPYSNAKELAEAYEKEEIRKIKMKRGYRSKLKPRVYPVKYNDKTRENSDKPPPVSYEPQGPRYRISRDIIAWMGWEFVYNIDNIRGPVLHDVRFKGDRILWELAMSEVALVYGSDSTAGNNILVDTSFNLGDQLFSALYNVECPDHGTLMNNTVVMYDKHTTVNATCVFEADGERPLWRKKTKRYAAGLRETFLVVRTPFPVGNYDYTFEWHFHLDGSLKTVVHASGFLQAGFWDPENPHAGEDKTKDAFGYRVGEYTHGSMHDHSFAFRVDLDVLGSKNTFKKMNWKVGSLEKAHNHNGVPTIPRHKFGNETYYMHWETPARELGLKINMQEPERWVVLNENEKNKWGVYRGYEIMHEATSAQSLSDQHPAMKGLSFTKYHCAVTKYNETEMYATDTDLIGRLKDPRVSVDQYLNRELIVNEDIVLWVSLGFLHVPTAEDFPETMQTGTGFWLKPFNYFDENPVFDMPQYYESSDGCGCQRPPSFDSEPCYAYSIDD